MPAGASAVTARLERAEIVASMRAGRLRLAFHVNNTADDPDRAAEALAGERLSPGMPSTGGLVG